MRARDIPKGVNHGEHDKAKSECNACVGDGSVAELIDDDGSGASEDQGEGAEGFGDELLSHARDEDRGLAATAAWGAGVRLSRGRAFASHEPPTTENDAAHRCASLGMLSERQVVHALLDLELLDGIAFLIRNGFVEVGHAWMVLWERVDAARCASAVGPTGSSACQGSQAVRAACFSRTSER